MKKLPKYFIIRKDEKNPLWKKYLAWINETYRNPAGQEPWVGTEQFYGYTGAYSKSGTSCGNTAASFGNNPTLITLEYWNECVNEFQLPEKWCVKVTEDNKGLLDSWRINQKTYANVLDLWGWLVSDSFWDSTHCSFSIVLPSGYTEITFEQFKKYVLKQGSMEKKLIGYKLNGKVTADEVAALLDCSETVYSDGRFFKEEHLGSLTIERAQKLGILDLWFEPVYEEEFKVGDWVELKASGTGNGMPMEKKSVIVQLLEIDESKHPTGNYREDSHFMVKYGRGYYRTNKQWVLRKATPEEIAKAKYPDITIKGYKAEFEDNCVKFGCQTYSKEFVLTLSECLEKNDFDMEIRSEIDAIAKYFISLD